jgi:hypothetical protein
MKTAFLFLFIFCAIYGRAQFSNDSLRVAELNQIIDNEVVKKNVTALEPLYGADFVFSHGSGRVDSRESWLKTVARTTYPLRQHDSVKVELHPGLAIVKGKMYIERTDKDKLARYRLRYIRVFAMREKQWVLVSHITTEEVHEN